MTSVAIIGGGIAGLTTAYALQRLGLEAQVYEAAPRLEAMGKGIWVAPNAMQVLERLGLAAAVRTAGWPIEHMEVRDVDDGVLHCFDFGSVEARYGHPTISIRRSDLQTILATSLRPGTVRLGTRLREVTLESRAAVAHFEDGTQARADVLVGADGLHSVVRDAIVGSTRHRYSGQTCYRGIADCALPVELSHTCWEVWGGDVRFGFSALSQDRVYWFAPVTAASRVHPTPAELGTIAPRFDGFPPPIPEIIERTPAREIIRTDLWDFAPIRRWYDRRAVLIGDAAHAMTPNLGQGGAQAIEDAFVLAEQLARRTEVESALRAYQHQRMPKVRRIVVRAWQYGRVAHLRGRWVRKIRNLGMKARPQSMYRRDLDWLYRLDY